VRVQRKGHAFEGQELRVYSRRKHGRQPHLLLVLPDESRSLIPASWTDWSERVLGQSAGSDHHAEPTSRVLASVADLLRARALVDALLGRMAPAKESDDAIRTGSVGVPGSRGHDAVGTARDPIVRQTVIDRLALALVKAALPPEQHEEDGDE
jgi:hypothetical protein